MPANSTDCCGHGKRAVDGGRAAAIDTIPIRLFFNHTLHGAIGYRRRNGYSHWVRSED